MTYEPLHHKYRPQTFADLVGQEAIATTLAHALEQDRIAPAYLFTGPRGTGKTSSARILSKSLNCLQFPQPTCHPCGSCEVCRGITNGSTLDVIEIDAASNTGVDNIRELIEKAQFAPVQCRYKVYVIDECHMLSTAAFNALLKTLEEPPDRVVFVLATTDPQRVLPTIISRCQRFDFRRIALQPMVEHLHAIANKEQINIADQALKLVAQIAQGGLRDAESLLDQLSLLSGTITPNRVWDLVGAVPEQDLFVLLQAIASRQPEAVLDQARHLMERGREPLTVLQNLAGFYRDLLIAKTAPSRPDLVTITPATWEQLCRFAQQLDVATILSGQQHLRACELQVKNTTQPRLWLEVALMGLISIPSSENAISPTAFPPAIPSVIPQAPPPIDLPISRAQGTVPLQAPPPVDPLPAEPPVSPPVDPPTSRAQGAVPLQAPPPVDPLPAEPPVSPSVDPPTSWAQGAVPLQAPPPDLPPAEPPVSPPVDPPISRAQGAVPLQASPPVDPPVAVPAAATVDLQQVWQKVLQLTQPPGTQALLKQHAHLLALKGREARVGIKTPPLLKMAQERLPNIEAGFLAAFEYPVKVKLEVAVPVETQTRPSTQPVSDRPATSPPIHQSPPIQEIPATPESFSPPDEIDSTAPLSREATPAPFWQPADEVQGAVKSFALFFNGVVVDLERGKHTQASTADSTTNPQAAIPQPPDLGMDETDRELGSGEEDTPF
jgi:DNA polymerase III subunit gamma/tau